jgi:CheY-like chemotaxis protein/HPt (histidine-containing phosphotransfer) domain-containing protein
MKEDCQQKITILYGYHPERIEEQVLLTMLNQSGYIVKPSVQKKSLLRSIQDEQIDIALISMYFLDMDSYDLCDYIVKNLTIPVFMIASTSESVDIPKAFARGASDIIFSPYIKPLIFARIENYCRLNFLERLNKQNPKPVNNISQESKSNAKKGPKHYRFEDTTLLLAEDNEVNQQLMNNILTQSGIQVEIVQNGKEAVDTIKNALEKNNLLYDLILMDLQMPVMDGFSASLAIRELVEKEQKPEIPIIAITAHTSVHSREKCLRSGMVDFMPKPIDPETCLDVLSQWIHSDKIVETQTKSVPVENEMSGMAENVQIPEINIQAGIKRAAGNESLFKKMLLEFLQEYQNIVQHLEHLFKQGKSGELKVIAHTLKGLGGNIGAENLHKNSFLLEQAIKHNIAADLQTSFTNLVQTLNRLINGIRQNQEWLNQESSHYELSKNNERDVKALIKDLNQLDDLLEKGRTTAIDSFHELAPNLPDSILKESKHLKSLILSYDFDKAQVCLHQMLDIISLSNHQV